MLAFITANLAACGGSKLTVVQPLNSYTGPQSLLLEYQPSSAVPDSVANYVQSKMDHAFFKGNPPFGRGRDITVRYRFVEFEPGSRVGRAVLGPLGIGTAEVAVEAQFLDQQGKLIARVRSRGETRAGIFGGSFYSAIDRAVEDIRRYAISQFKSPVVQR
jgi:hypothetical protein